MSALDFAPQQSADDALVAGGLDVNDAAGSRAFDDSHLERAASHVRLGRHLEEALRRQFSGATLELVFAEACGLLEEMSDEYGGPTGLVEGVGWDEQRHPRWPSGTPGGLGGQFMRVGQRFSLDGIEYDVAHVLPGGIIAHVATHGKKGAPKTVEFTAKELAADFKPEELKAAGLEKGQKVHVLEKATRPAAEPISGAKQHTESSSFTGTVIDPYVDGATHDPSIAVPEGSDLKPEEWKRFGRVDQLVYAQLMERFGPWKADGAQKLCDSLKAKCDSSTKALLKSAYSSQFGSSTGFTLSLHSIYSHIKASVKGTGEVEQARSQFESGRFWQAEAANALRWDLYNRVRSPDVSLFHGTSDPSLFTNDIIKGGKPVFSGISQSQKYRPGFFGSARLCTPIAIRHVVLATTSAEMYSASGGFKGEQEVCVADAFRADGRSMMIPDQGTGYGDAPSGYTHPGPSGLQKKWLEGVTGHGIGGWALQVFRDSYKDAGANLPVPPEPAMIGMDKAGGKQWVDPPHDATQFAYADGKKVAVNALGYATVDEKGKPKSMQVKQMVEQGLLKPGDYIEGMQGTRYLIVEDKSDSYLGLAYYKVTDLGSAVEGTQTKNAETGQTTSAFAGHNLLANGGSEVYKFEGGGSKAFKLLKGHYDLPTLSEAKGSSFNPTAWVEDAPKKAVFLKDFQVGDKFKVGVSYFEVVDPGMLSNGNVRIKNLEDSELGSINGTYKSPKLLLKSGYTEAGVAVLDPADFFEGAGTDIGAAFDTLNPGDVMLVNKTVFTVMEKTQEGKIAAADQTGKLQTLDATTAFKPLIAKPPGWTEPKVGDTLAIDGEKATLTKLLKDGALQFKKAKGGVVKMQPDDPRLLGIFHGDDYTIGTKSKLKDLSAGQLIHGGTGEKIKPYMVVKQEGKSTVLRNLHTGEESSVSSLKSYALLVAKHQAAAPAPTLDHSMPSSPAETFNLEAFEAGPDKGAQDLVAGEKFTTAGKFFEVVSNESGQGGQLVFKNLETGAQGQTLATGNFPMTTLVPKGEGIAHAASPVGVGDTFTEPNGQKWKITGGSADSLLAEKVEPIVYGAPVSKFFTQTEIKNFGGATPSGPSSEPGSFDAMQWDPSKQTVSMDPEVTKLEPGTVVENVKGGVYRIDELTTGAHGQAVYKVTALVPGEKSSKMPGSKFNLATTVHAFVLTPKAGAGADVPVKPSQLGAGDVFKVENKASGMWATYKVTATEPKNEGKGAMLHIVGVSGDDEGTSYDQEWSDQDATSWFLVSKGPDAQTVPATTFDPSAYVEGPAPATSDLVVGDVVKAKHGSVYAVTGKTGMHVMLKNLGNGKDTSVSFDYGGFVKKLTPKTKAATPYDDLKPTDPVELMDLQPGDQFTAGVDEHDVVYQVVGPGDEKSDVPNLKVAVVSPGGHLGDSFSLDSQTVKFHAHGHDTLPPQSSGAMATVLPNLASLPGAVSGGFVPFKWHKGGHGTVYTKLQEMAPGTVFVDKNGKGWKLVGNPGATPVIADEDGKSYLADGLMRGRHVKYGEGFDALIDKMFGVTPFVASVKDTEAVVAAQELEPNATGQTIDELGLGIGDVVTTSLGDGPMKITSIGPVLGEEGTYYTLYNTKTGLTLPVLGKYAPKSYKKTSAPEGMFAEPLVEVGPDVPPPPAHLTGNMGDYEATGATALPQNMPAGSIFQGVPTAAEPVPHVIYIAASDPSKLVMYDLTKDPSNPVEIAKSLYDSVLDSQVELKLLAPKAAAAPAPVQASPSYPNASQNAGNFELGILKPGTEFTLHHADYPAKGVVFKVEKHGSKLTSVKVVSSPPDSSFAAGDPVNLAPTLIPETFGPPGSHEETTVAHGGTFVPFSSDPDDYDATGGAFLEQLEPGDFFKTATGKVFKVLEVGDATGQVQAADGAITPAVSVKLAVTKLTPHPAAINPDDGEGELDPNDDFAAKLADEEGDGEVKPSIAHPYFMPGTPLSGLQPGAVFMLNERVYKLIGFSEKNGYKQPDVQVIKGPSYQVGKIVKLQTHTMNMDVKQVLPGMPTWFPSQFAKVVKPGNKSGKTAKIVSIVQTPSGIGYVVRHSDGKAQTVPETWLVPLKGSPTWKTVETLKTTTMQASDVPPGTIIKAGNYGPFQVAGEHDDNGWLEITQLNGTGGTGKLGGSSTVEVVMSAEEAAAMTRAAAKAAETGHVSINEPETPFSPKLPPNDEAKKLSQLDAGDKFELDDGSVWTLTDAPVWEGYELTAQLFEPGSQYSAAQGWKHGSNKKFAGVLVPAGVDKAAPSGYDAATSADMAPADPADHLVANTTGQTMSQLDLSVGDKFGYGNQTWTVESKPQGGSALWYAKNESGHVSAFPNEVAPTSIDEWEQSAAIGEHAAMWKKNDPSVTGTSGTKIPDLPEGAQFKFEGVLYEILPWEHQSEDSPSTWVKNLATGATTTFGQNFEPDKVKLKAGADPSKPNWVPGDNDVIASALQVGDTVQAKNAPPGSGPAIWKVVSVSPNGTVTGEIVKASQANGALAVGEQNTMGDGPWTKVPDPSATAAPQDATANLAANLAATLHDATSEKTVDAKDLDVGDHFVVDAVPYVVLAKSGGGKVYAHRMTPAPPSGLSSQGSNNAEFGAWTKLKKIAPSLMQKPVDTLPEGAKFTTANVSGVTGGQVWTLTAKPPGAQKVDGAVWAQNPSGAYEWFGSGLPVTPLPSSASGPTTESVPVGETVTSSTVQAGDYYKTPGGNIFQVVGKHEDAWGGVKLDLKVAHLATGAMTSDGMISPPADTALGVRVEPSEAADAASAQGYYPPPGTLALKGSQFKDGEEVWFHGKLYKIDGDDPDGDRIAYGEEAGDQIIVYPENTYFVDPDAEKPATTTEDYDPLVPYKWHKGGHGQVYVQLKTLAAGATFKDKSGKTYTVAKTEAEGAAKGYVHYTDAAGAEFVTLSKNRVHVA